MMIVATTAIDSEMIVVQMRGFVDHDDDAGPSCAESISAVTGLGDLWVGMQPVPDRAIFS